MSYTKFRKVKAEEFNGKFVGEFVGELIGDVVGPMVGAVSVSKADSYELSKEEKLPYIGITMTAASKTLTLGLAKGQIAFVMNEGGTNAVTVKNVSGDSGTSLAAGKIAIVIASETANETKVVVLN
ncbi:MAG: hypothetical protein KBS59_05520 [Clostridiales bacterium]|nr:hypothetical protein [Clostridiales bacterium]